MNYYYITFTSNRTLHLVGRSKNQVRMHIKRDKKEYSRYGKPVSIVQISDEINPQPTHWVFKRVACA